MSALDISWEDLNRYAVHTPFLITHNGEPHMLFAVAREGCNVSCVYDLYVVSKSVPARMVLSFGQSICGPWVVREDGYYRLYISVLEAIGQYSIEIFRSTDLLSFEFEGVAVAPSCLYPSVTSPCVLRTLAGYRMWLTGVPFSPPDHRSNNGYDVLYADSADGINFSEPKQALGFEVTRAIRGYYKPNVFWVGAGEYAMFVSEINARGEYSTGCWRSEDGVSWERIGRLDFPPIPGWGHFQAYKAFLFKGHLAVVYRDKKSRSMIRILPIDLSSIYPGWSAYPNPPEV